MSARVARAVLALAARCLGPERADWAAAMAAELDEVADAGGRPLPFALGCLIGAVRTMAAHREGRFALALHALAVGTVVPLAAILATGAALGFPFVAASGGLQGLVAGEAHRSLLNVGSLIAAPSLTLLMFVLAGCELRIAWMTLDRDWDGVAAANRFGAAAMVTLAVVTSCAAVDPLALAMPALALAIRAALIGALADWHRRVGGQNACEAIGAA